jgi:L-ribulose-5-phosphate 4-epimerase
MDYETIRAEVLRTAQTMLAEGLTIGDSGNVSARVPDAERLLLAITPHGQYYDLLTPEDIVVVDEEGEPVAGDAIPSAELLLHAEVYRVRPDVGAVIHTHSPMASAASIVGKPLPPVLEDQMIFLGGQIEVASHAMTGSEELVGTAAEALGDRNACLLANHGALCVGRDLRAALCACQYLEKLCQAYLFATWCGEANVLSPEVVAAETAFFRMRR